MTEEIKPVQGETFPDANLMPWWLLLMWGIIAFIVGIMFLTTPGVTTVLFLTFLGVFWLVGGLFSLLSLIIDRTNWGWKIFLAIIDIIAGIAILSYPLYSTMFVLGFFTILIGFWACFIGAAYIFKAFSAKDAGTGLLGIISLIFGLLILGFPMISAISIPFIVGGFAIIAGIASIAFSFVARGDQKITQ